MEVGVAWPGVPVGDAGGLGVELGIGPSVSQLATREAIPEESVSVGDD
jgi:hypothetical protein